MHRVARSILRLWLAAILAAPATGEESLVEQVQSLDRATPAQGWQTLQSVYDLGTIPKDPSKTSVLAHTAGGTRLLSMASAPPGRQPGAVTLTVAPPPSPDSSNAALRQKLQADLAQDQRYFRNVAIMETVMIASCVGTIAAGMYPFAINACGSAVLMGVGLAAKYSEIRKTKDQLRKLGAEGVKP